MRKGETPRTEYTYRADIAHGLATDEDKAPPQRKANRFARFDRPEIRTPLKVNSGGGPGTGTELNTKKGAGRVPAPLSENNSRDAVKREAQNLFVT